MIGNILLNIGDIPAQPGIQGYIEVINGENLVAQAKEAATATTGLILKPYSIYTFINCFSEEGAELVKARLSEVSSKPWSESNPEVFFGFFDSYLGPKSELGISVHGAKVLIYASPRQKYIKDDSDEEEFEQNDQKINIEFSIGHEIGTILASENKIIDALNALRLRISYSRVSLFSEELLNRIYELFFAEDSEVFGFTKIPLTLMESGDLQLNFKSASELPDYWKDKARKFVENEEFFNNDIKILCPQILTCLGELAEHTTGELDAFWSTNSKFQKLKIYPGGLFRGFVHY
ncbi:unnamed protein product [Blepharisma stoltei]|uniref:Uncharacterized protein n=1 Tax=Blepharisma stoltei TaxID=1481888 RepID=A0AAU9ICW9_9CILI|nr:unnamed protein product [Blepharisma stoltei]